MGSRAGIYVRISRDRAGEGLGVKRQEEACVALCDSRGWEPVLTLVENDTSAYKGRRRPEYERLLMAIEAGEIDAVVAWHPDRLHRSPRELERFIDLVEARRTHVATVQGGEYDLSTASGRMTARVVGAVARHESEHKAERQRAKMLELARAGKSGGGRRPYGFEADRVTIVPAEADEIRGASRRVLAGESLRSITLDLVERQVPTASGAPWSTGVLRRILISPRVAGLRSHQGRVVGDAVWPAVIDRADHERLVAVLSDPGRRRSTSARSYLLSGIAVCGRCAAPLIAHPRPRARCYACRTGPNSPRGCGRLQVVRGDDETQLVGEVRQLGERLDELATGWADGELDRRSWMTARARIEERLGAARGRLAVLVDRDAARAWRVDQGSLTGQWDGLSFDRRRAVVVALVDRVTVGPARPGVPRFDPDRITIDWR